MESSPTDSTATLTPPIPAPPPGSISTYTTSPESPSSKGLRAYWVEKNTKSLDGLPGVQSAMSTQRLPQSNWTRPKKGAKDRDDIGTEEILARNRTAKMKVAVEESVKMLGAFVVGMLVVIVYRRYEEWIAGVVARVGVSI